MQGNTITFPETLTETVRVVFDCLTAEQQEKLLALMEQLDKEEQNA